MSAGGAFPTWAAAAFMRALRLRITEYMSAQVNEGYPKGKG